MRALLGLLTAVHFVALGGLSVYGLHRLWLLACWRAARRRSVGADPELPAPLPTVTVQLPIYNERFVAARLIDAAAALDWPPDRLAIQVLDDSDDDTRGVVDERVAHWAARGVLVTVLRRAGRAGYKAGALAQGLRSSTAELVAVFDADFVPPPDFLRRTVGSFADPAVGMVQARWGFLNAEHSLLTALQALLLEPHFRIEHGVRHRRGLFFNFNGTAGLWRRAAIESAGGWRADTVTEDLDLSYRAQLAGWRFVYRDDVEVPSELPVTLAAFRSQQQRWAKGSLQTARKVLPRVLRAPLPAAVKVEAAFHLLANLGWVLGAAVALTVLPAALVRVGAGPHQLLRLDLPLLAASSGAILAYFAGHALVHGERGALARVALLPVLAIGVAPAVGASALRGLVSRGGPFERTPKFGVLGREGLPALARLYRQGGPGHALLNALLAAYALLPAAFAWHRGTWLALPFFLLFPAGFGWVGLLDLSQRVRAAGPASAE